MNQNITIRASAWGGLFDCAHRFEWTTLMKRSKPAGLRALLGTAIHASTAVFDKARLEGAPVTADEAADAFIETLVRPDFDVDFSQDDLSLREAHRIGLTLHSLYCAEIAPGFDFIDVETALDPLVIDCGAGVTVTLTGTMDRARAASTDTGIVIPDVKTGSRVIEKGLANTRGRSAQLGAYQLMFENTKQVPTEGAQIIALATTSAPTAAVSQIFDARRVMVGTDDQPGLIQYAADQFRTGHFPPNPQSVLCSKRYCARWDNCIFHE